MDPLDRNVDPRGGEMDPPAGSPGGTAAALASQRNFGQLEHAAKKVHAGREHLGNEDLALLDAWENQWFPVASAVLRRHAPEAHKKVFHNLTQTDGAEVLLSVETFLTRIDELAKGGKSGAAILALLARHGLTDRVLDEARVLIRATTGAVGQQPPAPVPGNPCRCSRCALPPVDQAQSHRLIHAALRRREDDHGYRRARSNRLCRRPRQCPGHPDPGQ